MNIGKNEIHLWLVKNMSIRDKYLLNKYYETMSELERSRYSKFRFDQHKHQYLVTRALTREVLSRYNNNIAPKDWVFETNTYGKPFVANNNIQQSLQFNLSHTEGMAILAVTVTGDIGVDIEYIRRDISILDIAKYSFSRTEVEHLLELTEEFQKTRFYDLWTLKESYIKACGMGLHIPLNHFSFVYSKNGKISIRFDIRRDDQTSLWRFWKFQPSDNHRIALALKKADNGITPKVSIKEIVPFKCLSHNQMHSTKF